MSKHSFFADLEIRYNQLKQAVLHKFSTNNNPLLNAGQIGYREDLQKIVYRGAGSNIHNVATEEYVAANSGGSPEWANVQNKPTTFTPSAHSHVIEDITGLQTQLTAINTLLASDNVNLDTLQEIVDAVEVLQALIVNDLTTGGTAKALSAQQGVVLKGLIDALTSGKQNNLGFTPYNATNPNSYVSLATVLSTVNNYSRAQGFGATTLTDAASIAWDLDLHQSTKVTLAGNRTLANPTNVRDGFTYILRISQDGTGNRTLAYGTAYKFQGGGLPTLSTTANAKDRLTCIGNADGTLDCVLTKDFR